MPKACELAKKFLESTWQMAKKNSWHANSRYIWQPTIYNSSNLRAKWQYRVSRGISRFRQIQKQCLRFLTVFLNVHRSDFYFIKILLIFIYKFGFMINNWGQVQQTQRSFRITFSSSIMSININFFFWKLEEFLIK